MQGVTNLPLDAKISTKSNSYYAIGLSLTFHTKFCKQAF